MEDKCKHGIFGQCSYCWADAGKKKEHELATLRQRLQDLENLHHQCCKDNAALKTRNEALEKLGREVAKKGKRIDDALCRATFPGPRDQKELTEASDIIRNLIAQARTLGLVEDKGGEG